MIEHAEWIFRVRDLLGMQTQWMNILSGFVYSSTNWPLLTVGQNLILNSVLKLNPLN